MSYDPDKTERFMLVCFMADKDARSVPVYRKTVQDSIPRRPSRRIDEFSEMGLIFDELCHVKKYLFF